MCLIITQAHNFCAAKQGEINGKVQQIRYAYGSL